MRPAPHRSLRLSTAASATLLCALALLAAFPRSGWAAALQAGPEGRTVPAGTRLALALREELSTRTSREGQGFTASVTRSVEVPEGTAIPRGAVLHLTAARLEPSGVAWEPSVVRLRFDSLEVRGAVRPVRASLLRADTSRASRIGVLLSVALMAAAAGAGALAGRWLGGGRWTLTGAALAGVAAAVYLTAFQQVDVVMPAGAEMEVRLEEPVEIPLTGGSGPGR